MALLTHQTPRLAGRTITYAAASAGGDTLAPHAQGVLRVRNGGTAATTVTVVTPGATQYGQDDPDIPVAVAAGAEVAIGPFPSSLVASGVVSVTYSVVTSVTVAYS